MGNAAAENSGLAFTPSSNSFAMPDTGGSGWTNQAFAPANSLTQERAKQPDLRLQTIEPERTTAWQANQTAPEKITRNLLDNTAPKSSSGFGGGLLTDNGESERKVNPIISKLAREHPENPVHLRGSLLGEPLTFMPTEKKPPNPFAQSDESPKPPKVDWTAYEKHRISGEKRDMHDNWARLINGTKDFGGIIPTFKLHIETNGDIGRGDVADMIGRAARSNPSHAQYFQRELSTALGGETIPARMARMVGEAVDNGEAPGLLGPSKPAQYDFEQMRKDYWQGVEAYKAELAQKQQVALQQEPTTSKEPRQVDPGRRGVISTNPENPAYPDRGNFADKLWGSRATAKPFVDEPRKGTYYFGGAGMDGTYIGDMVKAMQENGVGNAQAVDRTKWSTTEEMDAAMTLLRRNRDGAQTDFAQFGKDGKQFNMVGYSHGGLQAAQAAADYASAGGKVDHLVLVGTPISQEFLDKLKTNPNIGKVIVHDIQGQGDPIRAGMGAGEQIMSLPKLMEDQVKGKQGQYGFGHFYYAGSDAEGMARRRELAKQLYDWGLR